MNNENFIKTYKVDENLCDKLILYFKENIEYKSIGQVNNQELCYVDTDIKDSVDVLFFNQSRNKTIVEFFKELNKCYLEYIKFFDLKERLWTTTSNNIQFYKPFGGFKVWHYENSTVESSKRKLVYMLYLNNVKNGGTEWKYQNFKTEAVKGNLVIWPTSFTHIHRGIISDQEKYIATGWFEIF